VSSDKQQQILGYFIEETREHLDTLEHGLLNLPEVAKDPDGINELFRAAHSVKGGAAMLGFGSIQKAAHHLEDCLKILREDDSIPVDQKLVTLFLNGFDTLRNLAEQLQGPFGYQAEEADKIVQGAEPNFAQLEAYLNQLQSGAAPASQIPENYVAQVNGWLKQMLMLFKKADHPTGRQQLQAICVKLGQILPEHEEWKALTDLARKAIARPSNSYQAMAPVVIKDLKQGSDCVQQGQPIAPSDTLKKLATAPTAAAAPAAKAAPAPAATSSDQTITLPKDPKAAAQVLFKSFNRQQLTLLTKILIAALKQA